MQVKYKEAYEMTKAKGYSLHPEGVNFVNSRKANKITNEVRQHTTAAVHIRHINVDRDLHEYLKSHLFPSCLS